jgi:hypothetical protein
VATMAMLAISEAAPISKASVPSLRIDHNCRKQAVERPPLTGPSSR